MKSIALNIPKRGFSFLIIIALAGLVLGCSATVKSDLDEPAKVTSTQKKPTPPILEAKVLSTTSEIRVIEPVMMVVAPSANMNQSPPTYEAPRPMSVRLQSGAYHVPTSTAKY